MPVTAPHPLGGATSNNAVTAMRLSADDLALLGWPSRQPQAHALALGLPVR